MPKRKKADWRSLPRKPAALRKSASLKICLRPVDLEEIKRAAAEAGMTVADFVVHRALGGAV